MNLLRFLPEEPGSRTPACLGIAVLWPFVPAILTFSVIRLLDHYRPGMLTWGQYMAISLPAALIAAAGSTIAILHLPLRLWARVATALITVPLMCSAFGIWIDLVQRVAKALSGYGQ